MQRFIDNWSTQLTAAAAADAVQLSVDPAEAARLTGLGTGDYYLLTLAALDGSGVEVAWEIVKVTAKALGLLTVERHQEGSAALIWATGSRIAARATAATLERLRDIPAGAPVGSSTPQPLGTATPGVSTSSSRQDHVHEMPSPADIGAATSAQGALADSAVQPGDLADVATSGAYADLSGKPAIPSTAADVGAIATAQKGAANGVATLGSDSQIPLAQLPATAITNTTVVASEAAMLALSVQEGDCAIRTDISTSFILRAEPASTLGNWQELLSPAAGGGAPVGSSTPQPLGTATPGVSTSSSRQDHVHEMPSPADIGAATAAQGALADSAVQPGDLADVATTGAYADLSGKPTIPSTAADVGAIATAQKGAANGVATLGSDSKIPRAQLPAPVVLQVIASAHSLDLDDAGAYLRHTSVGAATVTVTAQADVAWEDDAEVHIRRAASGTLTITPGSGVTLNPPSGGTLGLTNAMTVTLKRVAEDEWDVIGQTVPA
jgi:hypothetical protein